MPKFLIERELPGAGSMTADEVHIVSAKSNEVIGEMAPRVHWLQTYVTSDKVYCVYVGEDEAAIREHADRVGVPITSVNEITMITDPATGE